PQSSMRMEDFDGNGADDYAVLGNFSAIASKDDAKANVSICGIKDNEFIMPELTEGKPFKKKGEVIANDSLKADGFQIGDKLTLSSKGVTLSIVGFTDHAKFAAAPVLYSDLKTVQQIRYGNDIENNEDQINGIVVRTDNLEGISVDKDLQVIDTTTFIENLPG